MRQKTMSTKSPAERVVRDIRRKTRKQYSAEEKIRIILEGPVLLAAIRSGFPWLRHIFADGGYAGAKLRGALARLGSWTLEIIKRSDAARGFELLPRRWVVERTFAWLGRNRRLAKDFEATIASAETWLYIASVQLIVRRLATS